METINRRHDIDWLRVITIGLLLIYHIAIAFQPWGVYIGFIQSPEAMEWLWVPMSMLNVWRIPLLFFVSGMGLSFAMRKRNLKQLFLERTKRILLPFIFGILFIVPIHLLLWQNYYGKNMTYTPNPSHLWFLGNIFMYVILLAPMFYYLIKNENSWFTKSIKKLFSSALGLLLVPLAFLLEAVWVKPDIFTLYAMTFHGFALGLLAFLFGFCFVLSGDKFWILVLKYRWLFFALGTGTFTYRLIEFELQAPNFLLALESVLWIYTMFGFAYKYLNKSSKALSYLSQGAYPIYILHMVFLYLASYLIFPMDLAIEIKLILVIAFTTVGCFACYDLLIKRIKFLRPLFGLKSL